MIIVLSCESVSAQWYLFPGRKKKAAAQTVEVPVQTPADTIPAGTAVVDTSVLPEAFRYDFPEVFNVTLVLPLQANSKPSANFFEMYSGALIAVKELGAGGNKIELTVIDESEASTPLSESTLEESHLVIGPVSLANIRDALVKSPEGGYLVSPLEPKAATLIDSCRLVQAPVSWKRQAEEVAKWIAGDCMPFDEIVVFKDTIKSNIGEQTRYLLSKLDETGCRYRSESRISEFEPNKAGATRIIIASDRDSYINGMVRDLSVVASQKRADIILYGTSSVRGSLGVDIEHLHNLQAHYTTGYVIDYDDPKVRDFILSYRATFLNEPGQFAFQGYDTMHYFLNLLLKYGTQWYKKLPEYSERGLQTDYFFIDSDTAGQINTAVRKVILSKDLSTLLIK